MRVPGAPGTARGPVETGDRGPGQAAGEGQVTDHAQQVDPEPEDGVIRIDPAREVPERPNPGEIPWGQGRPADLDRREADPGFPHGEAIDLEQQRLTDR